MNHLSPSSFGVRSFLSILLLSLGVPLAVNAQFHGGAVLNDVFGPNGSSDVKVGDFVTNRITLLNFDECNDALEVNKLRFIIRSAARTVTNEVVFPVRNPPLSYPPTLRSSVYGCINDAYFTTNFVWQVQPGDELSGGLVIQDLQWEGTDLRDANPLLDCNGNPVPRPFPFPPCERGAEDTFLLTFPAQVNVGSSPPSTNLCVLQAVSDKWNNGGSSHAVWMPGIYTDFIFNPQFGGWSSNGGFATLTGTIRRRDDLTSGFTISVNLSNKTTIPGPDSPHLDLDPEAYVSNGGPIDPSTWCYYEDFDGVFTGFGRYQGAIIDIVRFGPAWQLGVGANNKNDNFGAAAWFTWMLRTPFGSLPMNGIGDFNIDIFECIPASVGDFVWLDDDRNGRQGAGEPGLRGIEVQLLGCSSSVVLLTHLTDASGSYLFTNLQAGSYRVQVALPANTAVTPAVNVGDDATDSDVDPVTRRSSCFTLANTLMGSMNRTIDVGLIPGTAPAPAPRLLEVSALLGGQTRLKLEGPLLRRYLIEATDSPASGWEPVGTSWNLDGSLIFPDPMQLPSCLYRVKLLP